MMISRYLSADPHPHVPIPIRKRPMFRRAVPALVLACAAACRADAPRAGVAMAPAASAFAEPRAAAASPAVTTEADAYLVWSADSASAETAWLDAAGNRVATRPEVVIAAGGGLWAWRKGTGKAKGIDCQCMEKHDFADGAPCAKQSDVETVDVVDLASSRRVALVPTPEPQEGAEPTEQTPAPVSSAGSYLFAEVESYSYACGAHGTSWVDRPAFDLSDGAKAVDLLGADTARVLAHEGVAARKALETGGNAWSPLQDFSVADLQVGWTKTGTLDVQYRFSAGACYACGDGVVGSYLTTTLVPADPVPARLAAWTQAPDAVRRWWRAHPPGERAGWSPALAAGLAAFQAR
jgi:hypothetical protein